MHWWWQKKPRVFVKAACSTCGDVLVPVGVVVVSATCNTASMVCPVCDNSIVVTLAFNEGMLLLSHGAEVVL